MGGRGGTYIFVCACVCVLSSGGTHPSSDCWNFAPLTYYYEYYFCAFREGRVEVRKQSIRRKKIIDTMIIHSEEI